MNIIDKINKSRVNLKKYLENEWDTSTIENYSNKELELIYNNKKLLKNNIISFGQGSNCNFSLQHRKLPSHNLHIIYYNFPDLNSNHVKITKTCADKIYGLYENEIIKKDDSVIIIVLDKVSENLSKSIENLYLNGQEFLMNENLSENVTLENESLKKDERLSFEHFRNVHIFYLNHLSIDISNNVYVPKHTAIRNQKDILKIYNDCNCDENKLPVIVRTDPQAKILRLAPGDICKIHRISDNVGDNLYYRICQ